ncbi:Alpha/Beta hydrolase protein [Nemania sp. FL0916]|nr:Alpha/Beta hydrolase protein [Nemania sp. FL0916]
MLLHPSSIVFHSRKLISTITRSYHQADTTTGTTTTASAAAAVAATAAAASVIANRPPPNSVSAPNLVSASSRSRATGDSREMAAADTSPSPYASPDQQPNLPTPPAGRRPPRQPGMAYFPLGYKEAVQQWWSSVSPTVAERNVISCIPYLREAVAAETSPLARIPSAEDPGQALTSGQNDPYGPRIFKSSMVTLSGKNRGLNEFSVERVGEPVDDALVMLHGYGAGLGFYYKNFEPLSRLAGWKIYALDWLGMGNSKRPPFRIAAKDPKEKITEAENWFIDALEEWRKIRKLEKFTVIGHSLGGYLAVSYALKYPGHIKKLILASPVGVPEDPYAVDAEMPEPTESTMQAEFTVDQQATTAHHSGSKVPNGNIQSAGATDAETPKRRPYPNWLVWLWDANVSPFSIIRLAGPLGPRFVSGWTARRFNHLPETERQTLHDYAYSLFRQKGSGEYVLPYVLAPGAHARRPIINRIHAVGRQTITPATESSPAVKENGFPIVFMYGENDWMDVAGGLASEERLKEAKAKVLLQATDEEKKKENGSCKVIVVNKAGHHLYLDNPEEFNDYITKEMNATRKETLHAKAQS